MWQEELELRRGFDDQNGAAWALQNLGFPVMMRGDVARAVELFEQALPVHAANGDHYGVGFTHAKLGRAFFLQGDERKSATHYLQALTTFRTLRDHWGATYLLGDVGMLASRTGQAEPAARILAATAALRDADGVQLSPANHAHHLRVMASAAPARPARSGHRRPRGLVIRQRQFTASVLDCARDTRVGRARVAGYLF